MSNVRRVYVEKKPSFAVKAKELKHEISSYLGIKTVTNVRELIRYDVENISDDVFEKACHTVFAEPPVDDLYLEKFRQAGRHPYFFCRVPSGTVRPESRFCGTVRPVLRRERTAGHPLCYHLRDRG